MRLSRIYLHIQRNAKARLKRFLFFLSLSCSESLCGIQSYLTQIKKNVHRLRQRRGRPDFWLKKLGQTHLSYLTWCAIWLFCSQIGSMAAVAVATANDALQNNWKSLSTGRRTLLCCASRFDTRWNGMLNVRYFLLHTEYNAECGYEERTQDVWKQIKEQSRVVHSLSFFLSLSARRYVYGVSNWRKLNKSLNVWRSLL